MRRLEKAESRRRWAELRQKWNAYDPIGVMSVPDGPSDEYDSYVGPTLQLLEGGANREEILGYLKEVAAYMGLAFDRTRATEYAAEFVRWYRDNWRDTRS